MAPRTTTKPATRGRKAQAEPEPEENGTRDYSVYATKDPSITMVTFADWLKDVTGIEFATAKAEEAFDRGVALGGTLRMDFQRSEFWREHEDNPRNKPDEPKPSPRKKTAKQAQAEVEADEDEDEAEAPAPKRRGRPASGRKAPATKAPARRGRKPAAKPAEDEDDEEAPF